MTLWQNKNKEQSFPVISYILGAKLGLLWGERKSHALGE